MFHFALDLKPNEFINIEDTHMTDLNTLKQIICNLNICAYFVRNSRRDKKHNFSNKNQES